MREACVNVRAGGKVSEAELADVRIANGFLVAHGQLMAAASAAARQDRPAVLALHARPESVRLGALTIVRLKCSFGHGFFCKMLLLWMLSSRIKRATLKAKAHPYLDGVFCRFPV